MDTPICDFVRHYVESDTLRLHMPGHKGIGPLGCEALDITEISGADSLYEAEGIIAQSEKNASALFGCPTFYSTEGSSQCIRAMVYLAALHAKRLGKSPLIAAGRNAHKTFLSALALAQVPVRWLYPKSQESYLSCPITATDAEALEADVTALYLTSPDYLGNMVDVEAIAAVCHRKGILLLVDNAHGAYLKFLPNSLHPMDLGADLCCSSAHKTLPVLTGGAYLHIRDLSLADEAKNALALFCSTSPSFLILQSLDAANRVLAQDYPKILAAFVEEAEACKTRLRAFGYEFRGQEPMKLTIDARAKGYTGKEMAQLLRQMRIECEFADPDYLVLMLSPAIGSDGLQRMEQALGQIPQAAPIPRRLPPLCHPEPVLTVYQALFSPSEIVPVSRSKGRILASPSVGCPPAVPIAVCGERIDEDAIHAFSYYGIEYCRVCK